MEIIKCKECFSNEVKEKFKINGGERMNEKAFPGKNGYPNEGMDLRDYFAANIIQGLLSRSLISTTSNELLVNNAYEIANVMIDNRK